MKLFSRQMILPVYAIGVFGAFLQIAGAQWDVSAHILGIVETFFTPAHTVLYAGIAMVATASLFAKILQFKTAANGRLSPSLFTGVSIAAVGSALQIIAAPIDFWWHSTYGFDPFLFTPAHSLLVVGMILGGLGMMIGSVRLLRAQRAGQGPAGPARLFSSIVILALATVWAQMNFFGYWATDLRGMAYTFGYCSIQLFRSGASCFFSDEYGLVSTLAVAALFAASGTLVFWTSKSLFHERGAITSVAVILCAVYSAAALGFSAYALRFLNPPGSWYITNATPDQGMRIAMFMPFYLLSLVPVVLLDLFTMNPAGRRMPLGLSALVGPLTAFIDGRFSLGLAEAGTGALLLVIGPMIVGGVLGWLALKRLAHRVILNLATPRAGTTSSPLFPSKQPIA